MEGSAHFNCDRQVEVCHKVFPAGAILEFYQSCQANATQPRCSREPFIHPILSVAIGSRAEPANRSIIRSVIVVINELSRKGSQSITDDLDVHE